MSISCAFCCRLLACCLLLITCVSLIPCPLSLVPCHLSRAPHHQSNSERGIFKPGDNVECLRADGKYFPGIITHHRSAVDAQGDHQSVYGVRYQDGVEEGEVDGRGVRLRGMGRYGWGVGGVVCCVVLCSGALCCGY